MKNKFLYKGGRSGGHSSCLQIIKKYYYQYNNLTINPYDETWVMLKSLW